MGSTKNIYIHDVVVWNDLAQCMEVGYETYGPSMEDITFENITVLHAYHKAPISIHNGNNAKIKNIRYENITIEDASVGLGDGNPYLIDFDCSYSPIWSDAHKKTALGEISDVHVRNLLVLSGTKNPLIKITGSLETRDGYPKEPHYVSDVHLENISVYGEMVNKDYSSLMKSYANRIAVTASSVVVGASYSKSDVSSYGNNIVRVK